MSPERQSFKAIEEFYSRRQSVIAALDKAGQDLARLALKEFFLEHPEVDVVWVHYTNEEFCFRLAVVMKGSTTQLESHQIQDEKLSKCVSVMDMRLGSIEESVRAEFPAGRARHIAREDVFKEAA